MREVKADIRVDPAWRGWVREVLEQVRFRPDHQAIQKELLAHLEDGRADLERLGYPRDLAMERALRAMGDAGEVGRALDRAHKPWLGWLWQVSRWLAALALALALCNLTFWGWPDWGQSAIPLNTPAQGVPEAGIYPRSFQAGSYQVQINGARYEETDIEGRYMLSLELTASTPKFWLDGPNFNGCLEAEDSNGVRYEENKYPYVQGSSPNDGRWKNDCWIQLYGVENDPEWVDITHKTAGWTIRVDLSQGEEGTP
nr:permease prefix domain 1-containing protein [uncultured Oscillibacter sp.]